MPAGGITPARLGLPEGKVAEFYYTRLAGREDPPDLADCGSGSHGQDEPDQLGPALSGLAGMPAGLSETDVMLLRKQIAAEVVRLAARSPGTLAGGWLRWAEAVIRPQLDWRRLLAAKVRSRTAAVSGAADYSYGRPPRRRVPGVVLPAMRRPIPRVAVIIDTSASVTDDLLALAWTEVHGCLRQLGIRRDMLTLYAADADVRPLAGPPRRQMALIGGGGTDMAGAIATVLASRPLPDLVVVITDGLTPWPDARPRRDVIVALLPGPVTVDPPSWAHVVKISP